MDRRQFLAGTAAMMPLVAGCSGGDQGGDGGGGYGGGAGGSGDGGSDGNAGSGDPTAETATQTPTETPQSTPTETATPTRTADGDSVGQQEYPDYDWSKLADTESTFTTEIRLRNTSFHPLVAEVPTGTAIRFVNEDSFGHTVTIPALDVDERLEGNASTELTFDTTATLDYVCTFHPPGMLGRLLVTERTPTATTTSTSTPTPTPTPTPEDDGGAY